MKKEAQACLENSAAPASTQTQNSPTGTSLPEPDGKLHYHRCVTLSQLMDRVRLLIQKEERRPKMWPRLRRLVVELRNVNAMLATILREETDPRLLHHGVAEGSQLVKPFGPVEPTDEVNSARHHIKAVWFEAEKKPLCDTVSILYCLRSCFAHNPYLVTESRAIMALHEGCNALTELKNRCGKEDAGATAAEKWLVKQLGAVREHQFTPMMSHQRS